MTLELAIKTAMWQAAPDQEPNAYAIFERVKPDYKILRTDKKKPLVFDGWIMHNDKRVALVETKCRELTYYEHEHKYKNKWLLSEKKLTGLQRCAVSWQLPVYGFLYFINCKILLTIKLVNRQGVIIEREKRFVKTREKYLGGTEETECGFVPMHNATIMQWLENN